MFIKLLHFIIIIKSKFNKKVVSITKQAIIQKLDFFISKDIKVHITKKNKEFFNGYIIEKEDEGIYVIELRDASRVVRQYVFVSEIYDVEEYKSPRVVKELKEAEQELQKEDDNEK
jgi:hypothetical protein